MIRDLPDWAPLVMIFAAVLLFVAYLLVRRARARNGNADDPAPAGQRCCLCDNFGARHVPIVGWSFLDARLERSRRLEGMPPHYRIAHDFTDPRRLCELHYRVHRECLWKAFDRARAELIALNQRQWESLNAITLDREAPVPTTTSTALARASAVDEDPLDE